MALDDTYKPEVINGFRDIHEAGSEQVVAIAHDLQGTRIAVASADHKLRIFDVRNSAKWTLIEQWRAHDAEILEAHWLECSAGIYIGTIGDDNQFKLWREEPTQPINSGRRFRCIYSQSPFNYIAYTTFAFKSTMQEMWLVLLTVDGHLCLLQPCQPDMLSSWTEVDQIYPFGKHQRGRETRYALTIHDAEGPSAQAIVAGWSMNAISLAVSASNLVKLYRATRIDSRDNHLLQEVLAVETVDTAINKIAWSPGVLNPQDTLVLACDDATLRVIEVEIHISTDGALGASKQMRRKPRADSVWKEIETRESASSTAAADCTTSALGAGLVSTPPCQDTPRMDHSTGIKHIWNEVDCIPCGHGPVWGVEWLLDGTVFVATGGDGLIYTFTRDLDGAWLQFSNTRPM